MGLKIDKKGPKESSEAPPKFDKYAQYRDEYEKILLDHRAWKRKADFLLKSAALFKGTIQDIWTDWKMDRNSEGSDDFMGIYFMLTSFALENLFKALLVIRKRTYLQKELQKNPNKLPSEICGHDLCKFAQKCKFSPLDASDEELLKKLSRNATWYGRYPIPTKPCSFETIYISEDKTELIFLNSYATTDVEEIEKWVKKLEASLNEEAEITDNFNRKSTTLRLD